MNTAENKQLLQQIFAALASGDARPYVAAMADDFRWIINGSSRWSKTYQGKAAVVNELFPILRAIMVDRIRTLAYRFIADGDHVVVQARGDNVTRAGKPYRNSYCFVFTLKDGKLVEGIEYMDTDLALEMLGDPAAVTA
jgi:ketosteroid isomerase-like protein